MSDTTLDNAFSGLVTGGLGLNASNGLITMGSSLFISSDPTVNNYIGGLITGGLGLPANKGLVTSRFTVSGANYVAPPLPPPESTKTAGGGGGAIAVRPPIANNFRPQQQAPFYVPQRNFGLTRAIQVTVSLEQIKWTSEFIVKDDQESVPVKLININNKLDNEISRIIDNITVKIKQ